MRQAGEVVYADAHRIRPNEGYVWLLSQILYLSFLSRGSVIRGISALRWKSNCWTYITRSRN